MIAPPWPQNYAPLGESLAFSALPAALPLLVLFFLLAVKRQPAWVAALAGLATAGVVAALAYRMPPGAILAAAACGGAYGMFPVNWITFNAILVYRIAVETGQFATIKDSVGSLATDSRLQALLIAFAFGAFLEGAAGSGTPVAIGAAMLAGLGFSPFHAAWVCLLANTSPVAFGAIGIPTITLAATAGLPVERVSAGVGRLCAPIALGVPAYLLAVMGGWRGLRGVWPAALACGFAFALTQLLTSNLLGPQVTDLLSSLATMGALVLLFRLWQPRDRFQWEGARPAGAAPRRHSGAALLAAWTPYLLVAACVLLWALRPIHALLDSVTLPVAWPGLHNRVLRVPPVVPEPVPYAAVYRFDWLACAGTGCLIAGLLAALHARMPRPRLARAFADTARQMLLPSITVAAVLALAYLMNYSGATATLGLAFAATGKLFPYFSAMLGWLGVFLSGSCNSSNALFGNLQVITAGRVGLNPALMASSNAAGGTMGKLISLQSIAVAVAATGMHTSDEARLFRFTLRHSILLASATGLLVCFYAYAAPHWAP